MFYSKKRYHLMVLLILDLLVCCLSWTSSCDTVQFVVLNPLFVVPAYMFLSTRYDRNLCHNIVGNILANMIFRLIYEWSFIVLSMKLWLLWLHSLVAPLSRVFLNLLRVRKFYYETRSRMLNGSDSDCIYNQIIRFYHWKASTFEFLRRKWWKIMFNQ